MTGRNQHWLVGVSFGLLCLTQAALNIFLRLYVYKTAVNDGAQLNNVTEERDELKRKMIDIDKLQALGGKYFRGSFYIISSEQKSWQDSRADCLQRGADLVMINSYEEQEFMRAFKQPVWLGLTVTETGWSWVDGTPLTTSYWDESDPNNVRGSEHCAEIKHHHSKSWNDEPCYKEKFWICEKAFE